MEAIVRIMQMPGQAQAMQVGEVVGYAYALAAGGGGIGAMQFARQRGMSERVLSILEKAAVGPVEPPLSAPQQMAFIASLGNNGVFDAMLPAMRQAPLKTPIAISTIALKAGTHALGAWIPLSKLTLDEGELDLRETAVIIVMTRELMVAIGPSGEALFSAELRSATATATDLTFLTELVGIATNAG